MPEDGTSDVTPSDESGSFSCVVDAHPRFHEEAFRWFVCLTQLAGVPPSNLIVHQVGSGSHYLDYLEREGVTVRAVPAFDDRSPHCNKISGALSLARCDGRGTTVLCDTDIAILEDPRSIPVAPASIAGKPVDAPLPPVDTLRTIFRAAGVEAGDSAPLPWGQGDTLVGNFNGGLYVTPRPVLPGLATAWASWARWLLDRPSLLDAWAFHVDQIAMALAIRTERLEPTPLDVRWNMPIHDPTRLPSDPPEPAVIHYHQEVDANGCLRVTGRDAIDAQIGRVNTAFLRLRDGMRASELPGPLPVSAPPRTAAGERWVGRGGKSAVTSSGALLEQVITMLRPSTIIAVGTTDDVMAARSDSSLTHLRRDPNELLADAGRLDPATGTGGADLVVIDTGLVDELDAEDRRGLLGRLWKSSSLGLLLLDDDSAAPRSPGGTPTGELLESVVSDGDGEIYPLGTNLDRGGTSLLVLRPPASRHPRDYRAATLTPLLPRHPDPLRLAAIRVRAWRSTGFYPDHAPRLWEYPVVADRLIEAAPRRSRLVDVGAGVTPLVPYLTALGFGVDTVDPSPNRRTWPPRPDWNEWDYLDYRSAGLAHRSWNCTLERLPAWRRFDSLYSVSVIEHLTAATRRTLLSEMGRRVRPSGVVVLTVDLVKGTDRLWNRSRGITVEDEQIHGDLDDLQSECAAAGLEVEDLETVRGWGEVEVDIGYLACRKQARRRRRGWERPSAGE